MQILLACIVVLIINNVFTYFQMKEVQRAYRRVFEFKEGNLVSVGKSRAVFKKGSIAILSADSSGILEYAEMLEGFTILAKFKVRQDLIGKDVREIARNSENKALLQAIGFLVEELDRGEKSNEEDKI